MFCARFFFPFLFFSLQNRDRHEQTDRQTDRHVTDVPPPNRSPKTIEPERTSENFPAMRPAVYSTVTSRASTLFVLFARTDKANVKPFIVRRTTWSHATRPREQTTSPRIIPHWSCFLLRFVALFPLVLFSRLVPFFPLDNDFSSGFSRPLIALFTASVGCLTIVKSRARNDYENDERFPSIGDDFIVDNVRTTFFARRNSRQPCNDLSVMAVGDDEE